MHKPLFHEKTLTKAIEQFSFPKDLEERHKRILSWIETLESGNLDEVKETSLDGKFLVSIFEGILGYTTVIEGAADEWTLRAEAHVKGSGRADGALGYFHPQANASQDRIIAPIELKGAKIDLDRSPSSGKESPVDQGWRYTHNVENCRWVIVSNFRETRLYRLSKSTAYYELFLLQDLKDLEAFKRFFFLLCVENFLPEGERSLIDDLLENSDKAETSITKKLYVEYHETRKMLVQHLNDQGYTGTESVGLVEKAQKVLDRMLFVAFCEDKGLLPEFTIKQAHDYEDLYGKTTIWDRYKSIFNWVDTGNSDLKIPEYNGGLFAHDPFIDDQLAIPDEICSKLNDIASYDFDTDVSVEVLGRIFEQSVTDIEEMKAEAAGETFDRKKGKRKTTGIYYTPAFVTRYIVDLALGGYLRRKEEELREEIGVDLIPQSHVKKRAKAERAFWEQYRDNVLRKTRVVDPACGSGAFLIAAFDFLLKEYERVNEQLALLAEGQHSVFDLNKTILNENLFGVDLSSESVEITKLSLWLKTAEKGKKLTFLDDNIKQGNSIIDDPDVDRGAFQWREEFKDIFDDGGFDVVIGNPPYVRQERLSPIKPYLEEHYASYHGVADLYVYFYELGVNLLRPGGILSFIVTNKWMRAGYGEPLRRFFSANTVFEQILDFGHAKIFEDADVFPSIISFRKPKRMNAVSERSGVADDHVYVCSIPREQLPNINLNAYVKHQGYAVPWERFSGNEWNLDHPAVSTLLEKIQQGGLPLREYVGTDLSYGIKTGFNAAFLIDSQEKEALENSSSTSQELLVKYFRGQDIRRWHPEWQGLWMILLKSSEDANWPWSDLDESPAENGFASAFPAIHKHLKTHEEKLRNRSDQGKYWWELRKCAYYDLFALDKIIIQRIAFHSRFASSADGAFINDAAILLPSLDPWVLACLNSPAIWYLAFKTFPHKKDEALAMDVPYVRSLPIPEPARDRRGDAIEYVEESIEYTRLNQESSNALLDWLHVEMLIEKPGLKLSDLGTLDSETFIAEVKKRAPKEKKNLGVADLKRLREAYNDVVPAIQQRMSEILHHERHLNDLVNDAYGLTDEEIDLMWKTAPPRMPIPNPKSD